MSWRKGDSSTFSYLKPITLNVIGYLLVFLRYKLKFVQKVRLKFLEEVQVNPSGHLLTLPPPRPGPTCP